MWNIVAHPAQSLLFLEIRDETKKQVKFAALAPGRQQLLRTDISFEEQWWITLSDAIENVLLFTVFTDTANPGKKSLVAFDFETGKTLWWKNNFALSSVSAALVAGDDLTFQSRQILLDLQSGQVVNDRPLLPVIRNFSVTRPLQYYAGSGHFDTVSAFLSSRYGFSAVLLIEYLEYQSLIIISFYCQEGDLANFLIVLNHDGEVLFRDVIGNKLKGTGIDTFFVYDGHLIFVANKSELVSYRIL